MSICADTMYVKKYKLILNMTRCPWLSQQCISNYTCLPVSTHILVKQSSPSFCNETYSQVLEKVIDMNPNFSSNQANTFIFLLNTWHKNSY